MESKAMRRAVRSARAVLHGVRILEFIRDPRTRQKLIAAAETRAPPTTAISSRLAELVGARDVKLQPVKQFAGSVFAQCLRRRAFKLQRKASASATTQFSGQARPMDEIPVETTEKVTFLTRLVQCMTDEEAREVLELLRRRGRARNHRVGRDNGLLTVRQGSGVGRCGLVLSPTLKMDMAEAHGRDARKLGQGLVDSTGRGDRPIGCATVGT